jgi:hypothetical protein
MRIIGFVAVAINGCGGPQASPNQGWVELAGSTFMPASRSECGVGCPADTNSLNRFSGLGHTVKTAEAVRSPFRRQNTPLKWGVLEIGDFVYREFVKVAD